METTSPSDAARDGELLSPRREEIQPANWYRHPTEQAPETVQMIPWGPVDLEVVSSVSS